SACAFSCRRYRDHPQPHSFPTRRSSDLRGALLAELDRPAISELAAANLPSSAKAFRAVTDAYAKRQAKAIITKKEQDAKRKQMRSEEHTSELQSPDHLVCRLLLEKKNMA